MRQTFLLLCMLVTFGACNDTATSNSSAADTTGIAKPETANAKSLQDNCACHNKENIGNIEKLVPLEVAAAMIRRHKDTRLTVLQVALNKQDTRFVTYKITDLIDYLTHAYCNRGADSVRVYYGVHAPDVADINKRDMQTVLFIPTESGKDMIIDGNVPMQAFDEGQLCPPPFPCSRAGAILMNMADTLNPEILKL